MADELPNPTPGVVGLEPIATLRFGLRDVPHGVEIPSIKVDGLDGVELSLQNGGIVIRNVLILTAVKNSLVRFLFCKPCLTPSGIITFRLWCPYVPVHFGMFQISQSSVD